MRKPQERGTPINIKRYREWTNRFGSYRSGVTKNIVESWLGQFKKKDKDLAARTLDAVLFFEQSQIASCFRSSLQSIPGWHINVSKRAGRWFFVALSGSAGESGDTMLYQFRLANNLDHKRYDSLFIHRSDLIAQKLSSEDTVVLIDDFSGTGDQACAAWNDPYSELVTGAERVFLLVIAATKTAQKRVAKETSMSLLAAHYLTDKDNALSTKCVFFSPREKESLLDYGNIADKKVPKGYGECGLLVVFQHRCPSNSLPILHATNNKWSGLFPRYD